MQRCTRCVLPQTVPTIEFNNEGVCNFCINFEKKDYLGKDKLDQVIEEVRAKGRRYDCIVPISGGRDSAFALYIACRIYNLKTLAVHFDNDFSTKEAELNVKNACEILGVDYEIVRSKTNACRKITKHMLLSWVDKTTRGGVCYGCGIGYRSAAYIYATKYKVPLIIWGRGDNVYSIKAEHSLLQAVRGINPSSFRKKWFRRKLLKIHFYPAIFHFFKIKWELRHPGSRWLEPHHLKSNDTREINLFDYLTWDRKEIKNTIMNELNWQKPTDRLSTWKVDCKIHPLDNYFFYLLFGCTRDCLGYTTMINEDQIEREEALQQEEEAIRRIEDNVINVLRDEIGLTPKQTNKVLDVAGSKLSAV